MKIFRLVGLSLVLVLGLHVAALAQQTQPQTVWDHYWLEAAAGAAGSAAGYLLGVLASEAGLCDDAVDCGLLLGVPLGATAGVALIGARNGVRGNLWLAPAGALLGAMTGIWIDLALILATKPDIEILVFTHTLSGLLAAVGYNLGAKLAEP